MRSNIQPLYGESGDDSCPVTHGRQVKMFSIVVHFVPHLGERTRDEMQDLDAPLHERDMVVLNVASAKVLGL